MSRFLVLFLVLLCFFGRSFSSYEGYKIFDVMPTSNQHSELLWELANQSDQFDFFNLHKLIRKPIRVMISPEAEEPFEKLLRRNNITKEVVTENVGEAIAREFYLNQLQRTLNPIDGQGTLNTERYYTHEQIINYIDDLAVRYPSRVFVKTVGWSYERRVLKTIRITNGDGRANKKVIFVDGGFHAREWISPAAALYVIHQLVEKYKENADLLLKYDWVVLPLVNPDGYEHTQSSKLARMWRKTRQPYKYLGKTCYGADPNRNFDFHWKEEGASSLPCSDTYAGPNAFSEPETIVVRDLLHTFKGCGIMYLTLHSFGNYLLYPWGWTNDLPDTWEDLDEVTSAGAKAIQEETGTEYTYGSSTNVLYIAAGASDDYAFYTGFPISITMELPQGGITGFDPPASRIDELVQETWIGIRAMAKKVIEKY